MPPKQSPLIKAWKMVDAKDAHFLEEGCLKLGTFESYAKLENGRGDKHDAASIFTGEYEFNDTPKDRALLARITGDEVEAVPMVTFGAGVTLIRPPPPMWVFCMTEVGNSFDPDPSVEKAIFEIDDVFGLSLAICRALKSEVELRCELGPVRYKPPVQIADALQHDDSAFNKHPRFALEREMRIVIHPANLRDVSSLDIAFPQSKRIASHLKRIS